MDDFKNSDSVQCPIDYTLVDENNAPLSPLVANIVKYNAKGWIEVDQSQYTGGYINLKV